MKICHVLPFAPYRCGLYEAARDMIKADYLIGGHEVIIIDAGIIKDGKMVEEGKENQIDNRSDYKLITDNLNKIDEADIIIMHTGLSDNILVRTDAPLIWVVHGRPLACFRPEIQGKSQAYSLYHNVSKWSRTKKMLYFWPEYIPHWKPIFQEKNLCLDYPVIDSKPFNQNLKHTFSSTGKYNLILCDADREDYDIYETLIGVLEASKHIEGLKLHIYGLEFPLNNPYNILLGIMKEKGILGDLLPRTTELNKVFNSGDCLITPNHIITRTIGEAINAGLPIICQESSKVTPYSAKFNDTFNLVSTIQDFCEDFDAGINLNNKDLKEGMSLINYSNKMDKIYKEIKK